MCKSYSRIPKEINVFNYVSIYTHLKYMVEKNFEIINNYFSSSREFMDLIDGKHYKNIKKENRLHLLIFTDGIEVVKSTRVNFWPVFVTLAELPFSLRQSIQGKIICGLWQGKAKPNSEQLFKHLDKEIKQINNNKMQIITKTNENYLIDFEFYSILVDTPGKSMILNFVGHNGYYGCPYCFIPGIFIISIFKNKKVLKNLK